MIIKEKRVNKIIDILLIGSFIILGLIVYLQIKRYSNNEKEIIKKSEEYVKYKECIKINNMYYCK